MNFSQICKKNLKVRNDLQEVMASIKWNLWHGKSAEALEKIGEIDDCVIMHEEDHRGEKRYEKLKAFEDCVSEFYTYISNNQGFIIN